MPGVRLPFQCVVCKTRTNPKNRRKINSELKQLILKRLPIELKDTDVLCNKCRIKHFYKLSPVENFDNKLIDQSDNEEYQPPVSKKTSFASPPSVRLNIPSTPKSHSRCFICKRPGPKLIVVPSEARFTAFVQRNVIIKSGTRCCPVHMDESQIKDEALQSVKASESAFVNRAIVLELLNKLRASCNKTQKRFDFNTLNNEEYVDLTGLNKEAIRDIFAGVEGRIRNTPVRDILTTVGIFFFKLKSGLSNTILSIIFGISKSSVRRAIATTRQTLKENFLPLNLGFNHISRQKVINQHTRQLARSLFVDEAGDSSRLILVLDGTYIYIQKSQNHHFQRRSYNMHKGRPLVKPMVIVTTSGHYMSVLGPYLSDEKNNDAKILNHIINTNVEDIKSYVHPGDIFVVDRGFRDSLQLLEDLGIQSKMPSFLPKGETQFQTEVANTSRLVTKNSLKTEIEESNLDKSRAVWVPVSDTDLEDFPRLTEDILRTLTCGVYQLKLCPGYIQEHLEGDEDIRVHKERSGLIRVRLQSRHVSAKQYNLWIKFNNYEILGWYCKCRSGSRIVGMCAHCAAVIWYLGYGKHRFLGALGVRDWSEYVDDASVVPPTVDSSDSDSD
ncbi:hypothetical protein MAR_021255 [Mya arenaria]|uniref:Transposase IS4-like domain-containing protein n=1 Tax=Mya arenaria TaxID=6604 RepID=A0ABY7EAD9_MYAAR|nr:hypothetical protein MAR_021255 [Mya arenaria]